MVQKMSGVIPERRSSWSKTTVMCSTTPSPPRQRKHRFLEVFRWLVYIGLLSFASIEYYTFDSHGHITGFGGDNGGSSFSGFGGEPSCAGGLMPIIMYGCNTGVWDLDCGNNDGCLSMLLARCHAQARNYAHYQGCVQHVTSFCTIYGNLRPPDQGHIFGCAAETDIH